MSEDVEGLDTAKKALDEALESLQWVDLDPGRIEEGKERYLQQSEQAVRALYVASCELEQAARSMREDLGTMRILTNAQKPHQQGVHRALVLSHLYPSVETPLFHLVATAYVPRIIIKRRTFRYELSSLHAQLTDSTGHHGAFQGSVGFHLRLFTSNVPNREIVNTRRGAPMLMGRVNQVVSNPSEVAFTGVSFAEVTNYLPLGTVTLVCSADTSLIEPLLILGVRVRGLGKRTTS